ncbi:phage head closure protein [Gracilibacillus saliphilus]|uniref:phage head closure protein n=1 Tax=Gracilibacillus saliphilus TaxID=543890 RepID=UPI0013D30AF7|nr:phage head closure protein [Gracilibacillus saliphilus]
MRRDKVIYLVPYLKKGKNEYSDPITVPGDKKKVFATKKSITRTEFYQAAVSDFRPQITFVIWQHEYADEDNLEFKGKLYNIIRTFEPDEKEIELVCQGLSNNG